MNASVRRSGKAGRSGGGALPPGAALPDLVRLRIERALPGRARYKYVQPRVEAIEHQGRQGWLIVSANCSRNIDPAGGEIPIALLMPAEPPAPAGHWQLHARDHAQAQWQAAGTPLPLSDALAQLCADPQRRYWQ